MENLKTDAKSRYNISDYEESTFVLKDLLIPFLQQGLLNIDVVSHKTNYVGIDYEKRDERRKVMNEELKKLENNVVVKDETKQTIAEIEKRRLDLYIFCRDIHVLLKKVGEYYKARNCALVELNAAVNVCGDTHGQFPDLLRIFNACGAPSKTRYLFLGDYIDRGRFSVEVIVFLFCLKLTFPTKVYLLRGNHELYAINKAYGFMIELRTKFKLLSPNTHISLHNHFNEVFSWMPLAACISKRILCMHGGISPHLNTLDDIRKIALPLTTVKTHPLASDLLWADPDMEAVGFMPNKVRAISHIFGEKEVEEMCKKLDIDFIIRAHQVVEYGYAFFASRRMVTVFSATRYQCNLDNYAAIVVINKHLEISFTQLKPDEYDLRPNAEHEREQATRNT